MAQHGSILDSEGRSALCLKGQMEKSRVAGAVAYKLF